MKYDPIECPHGVILVGHWGQDGMVPPKKCPECETNRTVMLHDLREELEEPLPLCVKCNHIAGQHSWDAVNGVIFCPAIDCECVSKKQSDLYTKDTVDDAVNHPSHYTQYHGLEIIDLTEQMNFNKGNAVKYIARAGFKGGPEKEIEDLEKAQWYISRELERIQNNLTGPLREAVKEE